jgi:hypothetical protein
MDDSVIHVHLHIISYASPAVLPNFKQNLMLALCSTSIFRRASEQYCSIQGQNTRCSDACALKLQTATCETLRILRPQLANR